MKLPIKSKLLSKIPFISHGFFTRHDRIQNQKFLHTKEDIKKYFGFQHMIINTQCHSTKVYFINDPLSTLNPGDGLMTQTPDVLCAVKTADCMPIIFAHPKKKLVCIIHAGWKGLLAGIIEQTIQLLSTYCNIQDIYCAIGPCLLKNNFEVGAEVYTLSKKSEYFEPLAFDKYLFDMPGYAASILKDLHVTHVDCVYEDTYTQPEKFFSYRRSCHQNLEKGNQISVVGIIPDFWKGAVDENS